MPASLPQRVLRAAGAPSLAGRPGRPMGELVDDLVAAGASAEEVERAVWSLLAEGRLLLAGFLGRTVRRRGPGDPQPRLVHTYEPLLTPAPAASRQLALDLP